MVLFASFLFPPFFGRMINGLLNFERVFGRSGTPKEWRMKKNIQIDFLSFHVDEMFLIKILNIYFIIKGYLIY